MRTPADPFSLDPRDLERRERQRAALVAYRASAARCAAANARGFRCGMPVPEEGMFCRLHAHGTRQMPPRKLKTASAARAQAAREHARTLRQAWRLDPWTPGFTVRLDDVGESAVQAWLRAHGLAEHDLAPALADWLRWRIRNHLRRGQDIYGPEGHRTHDALMARKFEIGPPPGDDPLRPDLTEQSERECWRVSCARSNGRGVPLEGDWKPPVRAHKRRLIPMSQAQRDERARLARAANERAVAWALARLPASALPAPPWLPIVGEPFLRAFEVSQLLAAAQLDRELGIYRDGPHVRDARLRIDIARLRNAVGPEVWEAAMAQGRAARERTGER